MSGGINPTITGGGLQLPSSGSISGTSAGGDDVDWPTGAPSLAYVEVTEVDGVPDVVGVSKLIFSNGSVTDNADGSVTVSTGGGGSGNLDGGTAGSIYGGTTAIDGGGA